MNPLAERPRQRWRIADGALVLPTPDADEEPLVVDPYDAVERIHALDHHTRLARGEDDI